ncbi:branched-chain amino acid transport system ATP-binding protein/neutral amino acid transport system ATP-binding protein [Palleronia aestuarii]|uniref:Branched-chain amino acid transport system ATP-binding protein/neutral amino acid transport system ATP-binding protein n=1 Tax=Palleronia aestuarii TaxID=568105 RepID=A0A2W7NHE9_9RHOB|nr:ABC transporter ATP-binding protein [Palleronia aestuarii]PZX19861.1 branched-chain amino acid transport system ATP-binding protein/neutral amino acid transport system ATP-binding protein [Palleronia aestuarii]
MSLFEARDVVAGYSPTDMILKGVTVTAAVGEIVAIIGPNGAGKSTLLKSAAGQVHVAKGDISIDGRKITGLRPRDVAAAGVAYVPQEQNVFTTMTVRENLEIGGYVDAAGSRDRIDAALRRFPVLGEKARDAARTLSGGQRQLLAMAIAMMVAPRVLLLDEPSAGLSPVAARDMFATIREIADGGVAVVLVEQNALDALDLADRAYILAAGQNHTEGTGADLAADPDIRRTFLGGRQTGDQR